MTNTRPLIIAVEIAGKLPNPHLGPFLKYADNSGLKPNIILLAAAGEEVARDVLAMLGAHSFKTENPDALPEGICAYFPSPEGRDGLIREALSTGCLVLQTTSENYYGMALDDFKHGFLHNGDAEWYARIFPEPVHLADPAKINLGLGVTVNPRAIVLNAGLEGHGGRVSIGRASHVGADVLLNLGDTDFTVGNFTMISANFAAHAMRHSITHISNFAITKGPFKFFGKIHDGSEPINIGHDVWIGEGVKCLAGVSIGNGAVVGAASVVTKPVEPYAIYAGNPARLIRYRFSPEKIAFLNECGWWELSFARLRDIRESFRMDVTDIPLTELKKLF